MRSDLSRRKPRVLSPVLDLSRPRGDEPRREARKRRKNGGTQDAPARAGMNPVTAKPYCRRGECWHTRGDEPRTVIAHGWSRTSVEARTASTSEPTETGVAAAAFPRICSTGCFNRRAGPGQPVRCGWKGFFGRCTRDRAMNWYGRLVPSLDTALDHENAPPSTHRIGQDRIGRRDQCDCMAVQQHCPPWAEP